MSHAVAWQPSASLEVLKKRSFILRQIREFFFQRQVMEVDTQALSAATVTDQHLAGFATRFNNPLSPQVQTLYLQTSPEYAMKRLLAAGSGCIYQLAKAFRNEEAGRHHNPEFTMLEWYRLGFDDHQLMAELDQLMQLLVGCEAADKMTYQQAFLQHLQCDPLTADLMALRQLASAQGFEDIAANEQDRDTLLQLLFSCVIEPLIGQQRPVFVYNFPASQAALARIDEGDPRVARRFELYFGGLELANGFYELSDPTEQRQRFEADNAKRRLVGLAEQRLDERFLAALEHGLPECAGVAVGIDRVIMLALKASRIDQVLPFAIDRA